MKRETGFTLIELLVAMTVTLIIAAATLSLFSLAVNVNASGTQMSTINGNLRSALNLISRDLLQAGQGIPTGGVGLPTGTGCKNINRPVYTGTAQFPYGCANPTLYPNMPAVIPGNGLGPNITSNPNLSWMPEGSNKNSDSITMVYQDNTLVTNLVPATLQPNYLTSISNSQMVFSNAVAITGSGISNAAQPGDVFLVYGSGLYRYVVATNVSGQTVQIASTDPFQLNQQTKAAGGTISDMNTSNGGTVPFGVSCNPAITPLPAACAATAQRVLFVTYFLDNSFILNGQKIPRLMRQVGMNQPTPVAEVIEDLELSYDYVNGTTPINNVVTTPAGLTDNQIRKVNVYLAARSDQILTSTNQYLRANMATQIDIRSLAFVNRYQ
ncbi:MAG TPA: prepilin-type N-terminal cleavage/methylation domain-containing protein [Candidatus Acidoferrales bacterium]|nr:prepilin-type N-terminal cleavage/methylation domain-containing protein [Candidatus Acidoferrales bacterium]